LRAVELTPAACDDIIVMYLIVGAWVTADERPDRGEK
jgi:hypothetical protein